MSFISWLRSARLGSWIQSFLNVSDTIFWPFLSRFSWLIMKELDHSFKVLLPHSPSSFLHSFPSLFSFPLVLLLSIPAFSLFSFRLPSLFPFFNPCFSRLIILSLFHLLHGLHSSIGFIFPCSLLHYFFSSHSIFFNSASLILLFLSMFIEMSRHCNKHIETG